MIEWRCYRIINIQLNSFINADDPLPNYENMKKLLIEGLKIVAVNIIYSIPLIIAIILEFNEIINIIEDGTIIKC